MIDLFLFLLVAVIAETIGTTTGFGTTMILLPIASFIMPLPQAVAWTGLFHLLGTTWRSLIFAHAVNL